MARAADNYLGTPLLDLDLSSAPQGSYDVPPAYLPSLICAGGLVMAIDIAMGGHARAATQPALFEAMIDGSSLLLRYNPTTSLWTMSYGAPLGVSLTCPDYCGTGYSSRALVPQGGQWLRVIVGYLPLFQAAAMCLEVNGIAQPFATVAIPPSGGSASAVPVPGGGSVAIALATPALTAVTALTIAGRIAGGAAMATARVRRLRAYHPSALTLAPQVSHVFIAAPIPATVGAPVPILTPFGAVYSPAEAAGSPAPLGLLLAAPGDTIAQRASAWANYVGGGGGGNIDVVYDRSCVNDASAGRTLAQMNADRSALGAAIAAACPGAYRVASTAPPCKVYEDTFGAQNWTRLAGHNAALRNGAVTGWDSVHHGHYAQLDAASAGGAAGALLASLDDGDGVHVTGAGRDIDGAAISAGLDALGKR